MEKFALVKLFKKEIKQKEILMQEYECFLFQSKPTFGSMK